MGVAWWEDGVEECCRRGSCGGRDGWWRRRWIYTRRNKELLRSREQLRYDDATHASARWGEAARAVVVGGGREVSRWGGREGSGVVMVVDRRRRRWSRWVW